MTTLKELNNRIEIIESKLEEMKPKVKVIDNLWEWAKISFGLIVISLLIRSLI